MQLFFQPQIQDGINFLTEEESNHCIKVLRHKEGDHITIIDGKGSYYEVRISEANPKKCSFSILHVKKEASKPFNIHIAIAPTKNADRLEWFIEKSTEIGIHEITLLNTENSERKFQKTDRLEKKAIAAMKQSLKASLPTINPLTSFKEFIHGVPKEINKFIAYVDENIPDHLKDVAPVHGSYCLLIGPEGDFSISEVEEAYAQGFKPVSLGKSRLRTETAAIYSCTLLNLINE